MRLIKFKEYLLNESFEAVLNRHARDFRSNTIEFKVKNPKYPTFSEIGKYFNDEDDYDQFMNDEFDSGTFVDGYAQECYDEICKAVKFISCDGFSFGGRSNGWFVILTSTDKDELESKSDIKKYDADLAKMESIVEKYWNNLKAAFINYIKQLN